ncbi:MAG: tRNA (adenosine(37)-N6)-threonylcarbamoyltransferase complex transferase subunit TsaD [Elusimicrobia bacterium]|nr:tRNA (adenosine(37)-N6)-threonylcarbamoyltransferase complex transferase subunit TsaD [Elusimicrobiota bacterium]
MAGAGGGGNTYLRILGIETSCDETAAAVIDDGRVLSNVVSSQAELHGRFWGVVPELASRAHQQKIASVVDEALAAAAPGSGLERIHEVVDAVAYTQGPGLAGALLIGKVAAQAAAWARRLPLVPVNHLEGHAFAIEFVREPRYPFVCLIVSGGHTDLVLVRAPGSYRVLGRTRDDAAGEVFDKVAKLLQLGYPGGPIVDRLAKTGEAKAVAFPRPLLPGSWDFSFSGLKTAVLYHVQPPKGKARARPPAAVEDVCASFQEAVVDTLVEKTLAAASRFGARCVVVGGGVAANSRLRAAFAERSALEALFPPPALCTDNGAMIARVAWHRLRRRRVPRRGPVDPSLPMRTWRAA